MVHTVRARACTSRLGEATARFASLDADLRERLRSFSDTLTKTRGMSAVRDVEESFQRHVLDSLALLPVMEKTIKTDNRTRIADVGCGPGLPGLVLAVTRPDWNFTLLDAQSKRVAFVQESAAFLGANNAEAIQSRAETFGRMPDRRECYDAAVARALADMRVLAELCLPLVRVGGHVFAAKGPSPYAEVEGAKEAIREVGGVVRDVIEVDSRSLQGMRTVVVLEKMEPTPDRYPRRDGMPNKRPL